MRNLSKKGYIFNSHQEIESLTYSDYLREFGSDETTTGKGVAPRLYVDGSTVYSWGIRGNNHRIYANCQNNREAKKLLFEIWERNVEDNWDAPKFFDTKKELFEDLEGLTGKKILVLKRWFKIKDAQKDAQAEQARQARQAKIKHDSRPLTTITMMEKFLKDNEAMIKESLQELEKLKAADNKEVWQVNANALIQKVCNNDFRTLNWKEVYNLIRKTNL